MRPLALLTTLISAAYLCGCVSMLKPVGSSLLENYAALHFVPAGTNPEGTYPGLYSVDSQSIPESQRFLAYIAKGRRTVSFYCSGPMIFDWIPSVTFDFEPGLQYELICADSAPKISLKAGA